MCIKYFYEKQYGITPPNDLKVITYEELYSLLYSEFKCDTIELSDKKYKTAPFSEYIRFLEYDDTDNMIYIIDDYDCDDFSVRLHGNIKIPKWSALAFGEMWVKTPNYNHAINVFVDNDFKVWCVEPQNDKVFVLPNDWKVLRVKI
jgi:hypothetical protein